MSKRVLTEEEAIQKMYEAVDSGDPLKLNELMADDSQEEDQAPVDDKQVVENAEDSQEEETEDAKEGAGAKDGAPSSEEEEAPEKKDWREALPDDVKETVLSEFNSLSDGYKRLEHYKRSNEGRVSKLNSEIAKLSSELQAIRDAKEGKIPKAPQNDDAEESPVMQELKESDPALYAVLKAERESTAKQFEKRIEELKKSVETSIEPVRKTQGDDYVRRQTERVLEAVPMAGEIVQSDYWATFINEAPDSVVELASSKNADDFLSAIDIFTVWLARNNISVDTSQRAPAQAAGQAGGSGTSKIVQARDKKLQGTTGVRNMPAQRPEEKDEGKVLEEFFNAIRKEEGYA